MNSGMSACNGLPSRLILSLILLCTFVVGQASHAKQLLAIDDNARFIGTWELVSVEAHWPNGHVTNLWGTHPLLVHA